MGNLVLSQGGGTWAYSQGGSLLSTGVWFHQVPLGTVEGAGLEPQNSALLLFNFY